MSTITAKLVSRFDHWLDRMVAGDDRYICAACDDRFHSRSEGIEHVLRCHPEYQGVVVYEGAEQPGPVPTPTPVRPSRAPLPVGLTPAPVPVHAIH
jgi:hypothetical protein